jgi:hypothetical protein
MNVVPFRVSNVLGGLAHCEGLMRDELDHIRLEFQTKDSVVGVLSSKVTHVRIPLEDLVSVDMTNGYLGTDWGVKLVLEVAQMEALQDVPGMSQGRVKLEIARKDLQAAETFVEELHRRQEQNT